MSLEEGKYYICLYLYNSKTKESRNIILSEDNNWQEILKLSMQFNSGRELIKHFGSKTNEVSNKFFYNLPKEDRAGTIFIESLGYTDAIKKGVPIYKVNGEYNRKFKKDTSVANKIISILKKQDNNRLINSLYNDFYYLFNEHYFNYNTKDAREKLKRHLNDYITINFDDKPDYYRRIIKYIRKTIKDFYDRDTDKFKDEFAENFCKYMCYYLENHKYNSSVKKEEKENNNSVTQKEKSKSISINNLQCYKYDNYPQDEIDDDLQLVDRENQLTSNNNYFTTINQLEVEQPVKIKIKYNHNYDGYPYDGDYSDIDIIKDEIEEENFEVPGQISFDDLDKIMEKLELEKMKKIIKMNEDGQVGFKGIPVENAKHRKNK